MNLQTTMSAMIGAQETRSTGRRDYLIAAVLALLTLAWLFFLADGRPQMDPDAASALHAAQNFLAGEGLVTKNVDLTGEITWTQPILAKQPLFTVSVSALVLAGLSPMVAGWTLTFGGFALAAGFLFLLARRVLSVPLALLVAAMFATQMTGIRYGISMDEEPMFLALSFAALWVQTGIQPNTASWSARFLAGMLTGLAILTSYQGLPLLICVAGLSLWHSYSERSYRAVLAVGAGLLVVGTLPFIRFVMLLGQGHAPAFDTGGEPTWYPIIAGIVNVWQSAFLGKLWVWIMDGKAKDYVLLAVAYGLVLALLVYGLRNASLRLLAVLIAIYLALVIVKLGGGGKPYYDHRYSLPIIGPMVILMFHAAARWYVGRGQTLRYAVMGVALLMAAVYAQGQYSRYHVMMKDRTAEYCPAPASIGWIKAHIPKGSVILGTQCTYQLFAESNDYYWASIPPTGDEASPKRWKENDLLDAARRTKSTWVVLITGTLKEPLLAKPGYGDFIDGLFQGRESDHLHLVTRHPDGLIYRVQQ